jgi:hypothetical protein
MGLPAFAVSEIVPRLWLVCQPVNGAARADTRVAHSVLTH